MPWPPESEPEDKLHEALFVIEETRGHEQTIAFLRQELRRLLVTGTLRKTKTPLLAPPAQSAPTESAAAIAAAIKALKFYAEATNYETRKTGRDRQSAIAKDGGFIAGEALAALAEDEEGE